MMYRKPSSRPRKLLLRIAAPAGVAAMLGTAAACSSNSTEPATDAAADHVFLGSVAGEAGGGSLPYEGGGGGGIVANPDADTDVFVGGGITGVMVMPESGR